MKHVSQQVFGTTVSRVCSHVNLRIMLLRVMVLLPVISAFFASQHPLQAQSTKKDFRPDRCELLPQPDHQVQYLIDGVEKTRWHFGSQYPRPFFYPFNGPSGVSLTRMGHPGAQNHDHHRSVWFAHNKVNGIDFWADGKGNQIRQKHWYRYRDGDDEAVMGAVLGWYDSDNRELMEQDVVAALRPADDGEHELEIQITVRPSGGAESVTLDQTNFGFLAVRVSKSLSAYFGGGQLTNSEGAVGEPAIFGKPARWMDYSGPIVTGTGADRRVVKEGITFFDHPNNPRHPTCWHVREDGWMGAAFCLQEGRTIEQGQSLTLRYLLYAHAGLCDPVRFEQTMNRFAARPGFRIRKPNADERHRQFEIERMEESPPSS